MSILSVIDFLSFLIYFYLGIYVLVKNPHAPLNRVFFGVINCFAIWAFTSVFFDNPHASKETAVLCVKIASIGWISFGSFALLFFLVFTEQNRILQSRWLYPLLIVMPVIFIYQQWMNQSLISDLLPQWYGWGLVWKNSAWTFLFFIYYVVFTGTGLFFGFNYWRKTVEPVLKRQAAIVFSAALPAFILGSWTNVLLPELKVYYIPPVANLCLLFWVFGIAYVIIRFRFLTITPATAAENILSTMTESLILLNPKGLMITVNKATVQMLGYGNDELEGRMIGDVFESQKDFAQLLKDLDTKEAVRNIEFSFKTKDRKTIPVILSATLLKDEWGDTAGIICVARDISDRIKMQKRVFAVHKLESIRSLAGGIAHEYNNKLSVLSCNIDLLKIKLADNQAVTRNIEPMKTAIAQISDLTSQLVAYAQEGKYQPVAMNVSDLVNATLPFFQHSDDNDIHINKSQDQNLPDVLADYNQMQMVLHIILSNASESMQKKGRIQIAVRKVEISQDEARSQGEISPGYYVRLTVEDEGTGMDAQTLKQIYDPFFSTKFRGRGLGMAAVSGIVKNHHGFIEIFSTVGEGTSVSIYLPVAAAGALR